MNIIPAVDLKSGKCVRLFQGKYDRITIYNTDPIAVANSFAVQGTKYLHIVDLDGARKGKFFNLKIIEAICHQTHLKVQVGGGVRSKEQVYWLLNKGVERIVIGSMAITQPVVVKQWVNEFGAQSIVLALDVRMIDQNPMLSTHGWEVNNEKNLWQLLEEYLDCGLQHVLCTDIQRDGTLHGPNINLYMECQKRFPNIQFQASGGISQIQDLQKLAAIPVSNVIIGRALYEKKFTLTEALAVKECQIC